MIKLVRVVGCQPAVSDDKCHQAEVSFCFTTTSGEIQQIYNFPIVMYRIDDARQVHENKSDLERPPTEVILRVSGINKIPETAGNAIPVLSGITHDITLQKHGPVHEAKCIEGDIVLLKQKNSFSDTSQCPKALGCNAITDLGFKSDILHFCVRDNTSLYPLLIGICQNSKTGNNLVFSFHNG